MAAFKAEAWTRTENELRERRVQLMRAQIAKRMLNQQITRGWASWLERWHARRFAVTCHRRAVSHLHKFSVSVALGVWWRAWHATRTAKLERAEAEVRRVQGMEADLQRARDELVQVSAERTQLRERVAQLDGDYSQAEKARVEQAHADKEARVELLRRQIVRRMLAQGLAQAWVAWFELYINRSHALKRLHQVSMRLRAPATAFAFRVWLQQTESTRWEKKRSAWEKREQQLLAEVAAAREDLEVEHQKAQQVAAEADGVMAAALSRQLVELTGSAEERMALQEKAEQQGRIDQLSRRFGRRIMYHSLTLAWNAWTEFAEARSYHLGRLRQVGNQLRAPDVASAFGAWVEEWAEARRAAERERMEREAKSLEAQLSRARHEVGQAMLMRTAQEDEARHLKSRVTDLGIEVREQAAMLEAAAGLRQELHESREASRAAAERAAEAERQRTEVQQEAEAQRHETQALLERLLAQQRASFDDELQSYRRQRDEMSEKKRVRPT